MKEKESILLSEPGPQAVLESGGNVVCRTWTRKDGGVCLLACNASGKAVNAKVRIGGNPIGLSLAPYGVELIKD